MKKQQIISIDTKETKEIRQHNAITNARYEMTANEMDIFFYVLSVLKPTDGSGTLYRVCVKDLEEKTGREWNYTRIKEAAKRLKKKEIYYQDEKRELEANLFASCEYLKGEGCVEVELSVKVRPFLIDLKNNYTSYKLYSVMSLTSSFAKRIYQMCSQWKDIGHFTIPLRELKIRLGLLDPKDPENEKYVKVAAFEEKVLEISKTQINQSSDLKIDYEVIKNKKKDYSIRFLINRQKTKQLPLEFHQEDPDEKAVNLRRKLEELGIMREDLILQVLAQKEEAYQWFYKFKTGQIQAKSPSGHLLTSLGIIKR